MKNYTIDNTDGGDIERSILWQYDKSVNLIGVIQILSSYFSQAVTTFWNSWKTNVMDVGTATDFGLSVLGKIVGVERASVAVGGVTAPISRELYRKIIKLRLALLNGSSTVAEYNTELIKAFGSGVVISDGEDMSLSFTNSLPSGEAKELVDNYPESVFVYPAGVKSSVHSTDSVFSIAYESTKAASDPSIANLNNPSGQYQTNGSGFTWR